MTLQLPSGEFQPKKWWDRPEKWVGLGVLGIACLWTYAKILPFLNTIIWGTAELLAGGIVVAFLLALIMHPRSRWAAAYLFDRVMFALTNAIVTIDPIGVMKKGVLRLKELKTEIDGQIANLLGQERELSEAIKTDTQEAEQALRRAAAAERQKKKGQVAAEAAVAHRRRRSIKTYRELLQMTLSHRRDLEKYSEMAEVIVKDKEDYVKHRERERRIIYGVLNAVRAAARILQGSGTDLEMYTQADEFLAQDLSRKVGVIEQVKRASRGAIDSYDLEKSVVDEEAMELFERFKREGMTILEAEPPGRLMAALTEGETIEDQVVDREREKVPARPDDKFRNLFK